MANATQVKFGYPDTLVAETPYWTVQTRPTQPSLGALVLVCKEPVKAFGEVDAEAFVDLKDTVARIEAMLRASIGYERINYLMLMMVDPDVHFHVLPRYEGEKRFEDLVVADHGWPGAPALNQAETPTPEQLRQLTAFLRHRWNAGPS